MPIVTSTALNVKEKLLTKGPTNLVSETAIGSAAANQVGPMVEGVTFSQFDPSINTVGTLSLFEVEFDTTGPLSLYETDIEAKGVLRDFIEEITQLTPLFLAVGDVPSSINPFRISTPLYQVEAYNILFHRTPVNLTERFLYGRGPLTQFSGAVSAQEDMLLVDLLGPQIFNEQPPAGSTFNNPDSTITFDLVDTGGSDIALSGVEIHINGTKVIDAGADVTPSGFGITSFTPVTTSFYQFQFISDADYDLGSYVSVSGRASDTTPSGNVEYFSYLFQVWDLNDLAASITGLPDTIPPFLENLNPAIGQSEVVIGSDILLTVNDLHTGVDLSTVVLGVENEVVFSGSTSVSPNYNVAVSSTLDFRGYNFIVDPVSDFSFGQQVDVSVQASDSYTPANSLDTTYSFFTVANGHLVASGLQIYVDTSYVDMDIGSSYMTTTGTDFHITYLNLEGTGISTSGSSVLLHGEEVPSTIIPVSGNPLAYDVFFTLSPDYTDNAELTFRIVQSGTVSGTTLFRDQFTELLWGYEFCYDNDRLPHDTVMDYSVRVCDFGHQPTETSFVKSFTTTPLDSLRLRASIFPVNPPFESISANLVSNNTFFEYGKTMYVEVDVGDFAGNNRTFAWNFTIEDE